ncbi:MAG: hypothetical protein V4725_15935 [Bacteroidota bacterium]
MSKKKYLLLFVPVIMISVAGFIYSSYTRTGVNIKKANAEKVTAPTLYERFSNNTSRAKCDYLHKVLEVSGTVMRTNKNQQEQTVVLLKTMTEGAAVNCTLEEKLEDLTEGKPVSIKGICSGMGEGDLDLGIPADVYLVRCYVIKN